MGITLHVLIIKAINDCVVVCGVLGGENTDDENNENASVGSTTMSQRQFYKNSNQFKSVCSNEMESTKFNKKSEGNNAVSSNTSVSSICRKLFPHEHDRRFGKNITNLTRGHAVLEKSRLLNMSKEVEGKRKGVISKFSEISGTTKTVKDTQRFFASPEEEGSVAIAAVVQHAMHKTSVCGPKQAIVPSVTATKLVHSA